MACHHIPIGWYDNKQQQIVRNWRAYKQNSWMLGIFPTTVFQMVFTTQHQKTYLLHLHKHTIHPLSTQFTKWIECRVWSAETIYSMNFGGGLFLAKGHRLEPWNKISSPSHQLKPNILDTLMPQGKFCGFTISGLKSMENQFLTWFCSANN